MSQVSEEKNMKTVPISINVSISNSLDNNEAWKKTRSYWLEFKPNFVTVFNIDILVMALDW